MSDEMPKQKSFILERRPDWWYEKQRRWLHNSFFGHAAMTRKNMQTIMHSDSVTLEGHRIADQIWKLTHMLEEELKNRVDK